MIWFDFHRWSEASDDLWFGFRYGISSQGLHVKLVRRRLYLLGRWTPFILAWPQRLWTHPLPYDGI